jgi:hypothetical protein
MHRGLGVVIAGVLAAMEVFGQTGVTRVWAVDDGEKVRQEDLSHWAASSPLNKTWDGSRINLFGGKNEIVAFQLILESGGTGARTVNVMLDSLRSGGALIANTGGQGDPFNYAGKRIELFREHYQQVTQRSPYGTSNGTMAARALPDGDHLGWIPDALIPFEAPARQLAHGQGGAPFDIGPYQNQGVWVDITIPRDAPAGVYTGTVRVTESGVTRYEIPLSLRVFNFTLPDETHQRSFFHWTLELLPNRFGITMNSPEYWAMYRKFAQMAHRHRMDLIDGGRALLGPQGFAANLSGYYIGTEYSPAQRYEGPGMFVGNRTYSIGTYDQPNHGEVSGFWPNTPVAWQAAADAWEGWFVQQAPRTLRFKYMDDEADVNDPATVQLIREKCSWIQSSSGPGKNLHRFETKEFIYAGYYGAVDVWAICGLPGLRVSIMDARRGNGELFALYNGTRPTCGQMEHIDNFATDNRVNPWIAWKYGVDLLFLWDIAFYAESMPPHPNAVNIWGENYMPGGTPYGSVKSYGSGMFFYTGRDVCYPQDDRGVDGPIASLRMKNFRRGQTDYEYLWLAKQNGIDPAAIVDQIVPHALDDWGTTSYTYAVGFNQQPTFPARGYAYETARLALAQLLDVAGKTSNLPTVTLKATPTDLPEGGGDVTLQWVSSNALHATMDNAVGVVPTSGSKTLRVSRSTKFNLTVGNDLSGDQASVQVNVAVPTGTFGPNVLANSCFQAGTTSWGFYTDGVAQCDGVSDGPGRPHVARISIVQPGGNVQFNQTGIKVDPNANYRVSFAARSNTGHDLEISLRKNDAPFTVYGVSGVVFDLTSQWKTFSVDFQTTDLSGPVSDGRLMFWLAPYDAAGDQYTIDSVVFTKSSIPAAVEDGIAQVGEFRLDQNFPNPFNPATTIRFSLPSRTRVTLKIFDLLGREMSTLVDADRDAGVHTERFDAGALPSGTYLCRLVSMSHTEVRKMVLVK